MFEGSCNDWNALAEMPWMEFLGKSMKNERTLFQIRRPNCHFKKPEYSQETLLVYSQDIYTLAFSYIISSFLKHYIPKNWTKNWSRHPCATWTPTGYCCQNLVQLLSRRLTVRFLDNLSHVIRLEQLRGELEMGS